MSNRKKTETVAKAKAAAKAEPEKKLSLMKAAIAVLEASDESLNTRQIIDAAKAKGLWTPGAGKTPEQTLYSAIVREIKVKGTSARFKKDARGHFSLNV